MNEPIQDKAPKPPGLLPKHVQSWLILGLAVLMIVIMWLTGGKKQQNAAKARAPVAHQQQLFRPRPPRLLYSRKCSRTHSSAMSRKRSRPLNPTLSLRFKPATHRRTLPKSATNKRR